MKIHPLALVNAALFVTQIAVNLAYAHKIIEIGRNSLSAWVLVYLLETVLVFIDVFWPQHSLYAAATKPKQLRVCFTASRVFNTAYVITDANHHVYAAAVLICLLLLPLLVLYVFAIMDRNVRGEFNLKVYVCNDVPVAVYFGWVAVTAFTHLAMALTQTQQKTLSMEANVVLVTVLLVLSMLVLLYAQDTVVLLLVQWYLAAVCLRPTDAAPVEERCEDIGVRACAGEASLLLGSLLLVAWMHLWYVQRYACLHCFWLDMCRTSLSLWLVLIAVPCHIIHAMRNSTWPSQCHVQS